VTCTVVSFHAHPDDEALLTGGTLALLSAAGHRVVLVVATSGAAGLSAGGKPMDVRSGAELAARRIEELHRSAKILGCARVVLLGYPDSGWSTDPAVGVPPGSFADLPIATTAARLAKILREEGADLITVYDARGGYGHADHVRVHDVGIAAAALAGTPRVLEATIDRTLLARAIRALQLVHLVPQDTATGSVRSWYSDRREITHKISVHPHSRAKRAALACHLSQTEGGDGPRTATILLKLPAPLFRLVCGREWFIETGAPVPSTPLTDLFTSALSPAAAT
jgi:LmbE family N-acetylglucosaminyl deacetylase